MTAVRSMPADAPEEKFLALSKGASLTRVCLSIDPSGLVDEGGGESQGGSVDDQLPLQILEFDMWMCGPCFFNLCRYCVTGHRRLRDLPRLPTARWSLPARQRKNHHASTATYRGA